MMLSRTNEKLIGVLFLLATASFMLGSMVIESNIAQADYLSHLYPNRTPIFVGIFLEFINSVAVVGISVLLFPLLKHHNTTIAVGYLSSRIIESILLIVGIIAPLVLLTLSETHLTADGVTQAYHTDLGNLIIKGQEMTFELAMLALGVGSVLLCWLMYHKRLIPRLLALLGIIGYIALTASSCLAIIGIDLGEVLFIPGGIFEIIFPLWLIFKGFNRVS